MLLNIFTWMYVLPILLSAIFVLVKTKFHFYMLLTSFTQFITILLFVLLIWHEDDLIIFLSYRSIYSNN